MVDSGWQVNKFRGREYRHHRELDHATVSKRSPRDAQALPQRYFVAPEVFAKERETIFATQWMLVGHQNEVAPPAFVWRFGRSHSCPEWRATIAVGRLLTAQLYQISPHNPLLLGATAIILALAALVACVVPARRATLVSPLQALRTE